MVCDFYVSKPIVSCQTCKLRHVFPTLWFRLRRSSWKTTNLPVFSVKEKFCKEKKWKMTSVNKRNSYNEEEATWRWRSFVILTVDKISMNSKLFLFYPGRSEIINWGSDESFRRATWTITKAVTKYGGHSKESGRCYKTKKKALTCKEKKCTGFYFLEGIFAGYHWLRRKLIAVFIFKEWNMLKGSCDESTS